MAAEEILRLFDSFWFEHEILSRKQHPLVQTTKPVLDELRDSKLIGISALKIRSQSDNLLEFGASFSPSSASTIESEIIKPELENSLSQSQQKQEYVRKKIRQRRVARKKLGINRSLSELELEELKGFMDLGFVFTEEDKSSSLASIIPGLQRWGSNSRAEAEAEAEAEEEVMVVDDESSIQRPYLSEAWSMMEQRKIIKKLVRWRFPPLNNETNMKDNLRFWAHTVASIVR